jgi:hypothetical protein
MREIDGGPGHKTADEEMEKIEVGDIDGGPGHTKISNCRELR